MGSILHRIKNGKKNHKLVDFPGTSEKVAIVILSSNETAEAKMAADEYVEKHKIKDETYVDIALQWELMYRALRDKDNLQSKIADSMEEFKELLDNSELAFLQVQYNLFVNEASPFLSQVTEEQFAELKKTFAKMNLSELSGESLVALRNFLMSLV